MREARKTLRETVSGWTEDRGAAHSSLGSHQDYHALHQHRRVPHQLHHLPLPSGSTSTPSPPLHLRPRPAPSQSGMLSPTLPDISFGANITLRAPLRVTMPSSARSIAPTPTRSVAPTPTNNLPTPPHEVGERKTDGSSPVLPDISLGMNVCSLSADLFPLPGVHCRRVAQPSSPPLASPSSSEPLSCPITDPRLRIEVTVSSQSPTSPTPKSPPVGFLATGEGLSPSMTGDRSSFSPHTVW